MKNSLFVKSISNSILKYTLILILFDFNKKYYYDLRFPILLPKYEYIVLILLILTITTTISSYIISTKSYNHEAHISYILESICSILYIILLVDLEIILPSMIMIILIVYLCVDTYIEYRKLSILSSIFYIISIFMAIFSAIINLCIVLFNM